MKNGKWTAVAVATVLAGGMATIAFAGDGGRGGRRGGGWRGRMHEAAKERRAKGMEFLASLQVTDAQRQVMLEKARAAAPIAESARAETRRIVAAAWAQAAKDGAATDKKALREQVRTQIKALRERTWTQIEPLAKDVVLQLTPEQRQKIAEAAGKRGKTVDDAKLARLVGFRLTRPMTVPYLEARLGVATPR
jgi:hypothetical protein